MNKLSLRDILRHLEQLIAAVPEIGGVFENDNDAASFVTKLRRLLDLVQDTGNAEPALKAIREALFPGAKEDSRRVLFSNFRKTLALAASHTGKNLALVQPNLRGKELDEVLCWFEGDGFPAEPEIAAATQRSIAGLDRSTLIHAPAAMMTGATLTKITENLREKDARGRQRIHLFISYAHKNDALASKCLNQLRDELAISKRYDFRIWQDTRILVGNEWHQDIQQALRECDLCLALCSPAFFASEYITGEELPLIVNRTLPGVPVMLEPVDFKRHDLHGAEDLQFYTLKENAREKAYTECTGEVAKRFVRGLAEKIEERVPSAIEEVTRRTITNALSDRERWMAFVKTHPKIGEVLATISLKSRNLEATATKTSREPFDRLLRHLLPEEPERLIDAVCAGGGLRELSRQIQRRHDGTEYEDPYDRFRSNQFNAVQYLMEWVRDPDAPPFAAVLGEIGSGKTTTLKMLTAALIEEADSPPIIFIDLRDYFSADEPKLEDLIAEHLRRYDTEKSLSVEELLRVVREQNGLIIFDGLDEKIISLGEAARQNFIRELWRILPAEILDRPASEGRGKLIISCRSHYFSSVTSQQSGYLAHDRSAVTANDYVACIMLPWQDEQIRDYLTGCVGEDKVEMALELIETIHNLKDLSTRPYLLNLIGPELEALERERASGRPINAASLYDQFVERWFARDEGKHVFTPVHKRRLMEQLAADLWRDHAREWPWERVEKWIDEFLYSHPAIAAGYREYSRAVLKQDFRTATMFLRPDGSAETFRFAHTSLQEFFLASHLVETLNIDDILQTSAAWGIPKPSRETFIFFGQKLKCIPTRNIDASLNRIRSILADPSSPKLAKKNALNYIIIALEKDLPAPEDPDISMTYTDLSGWQICSRENDAISFGKVDFTGSNLAHVEFKGVNFSPGSIWRKADLRGSEWIECDLPRGDFSYSNVKGAWFRSCNLINVKINGTNVGDALVHLCTTDWKPKGINTKNYSATALSGHSSSVNSISFSPNNLHVASGSNDGTVKIWDLKSRACIRSHDCVSNSIRSLDFSTDGTRIIAGLDDGTTKMWDSKIGSCLFSSSEQGSPVVDTAFIQKDNVLISHSTDGTIVKWDIESGRILHRFPKIGHNSKFARISDDGSICIFGSTDGTLHLRCLVSGALIRSLQLTDASFTSIYILQNNAYAAIERYDGCLDFIDLRNGNILCNSFDNINFSNSFEGSFESKYTIRLFTDGLPDIFSIALNEAAFKLRSSLRDRSSSTEVSKDGKFVASGQQDGKISIFEASDGVLLGELKSHYSPFFNMVAFSSDFDSFLGQDAHQEIRIWNFDGDQIPFPSPSDHYIRRVRQYGIHGSHAELVANSTIRLRKDNRLLRDIIPLPDGKTLVLEPWDEIEALKPPHECRWKLVRGPADAWRYAVAVDPETLEVHPPEYATENGTWEII